MNASAKLDSDPVQAIADWLGQPEWWWIEPTPLFSQSGVAVWGEGNLPTGVCIDEFWAWGQRNGRPRALHGVRRGDAWRFQNHEGDGDTNGDGDSAAATPFKRLTLAVTDNRRYRAHEIKPSPFHFRFDSATGAVLIMKGDAP